MRLVGNQWRRAGSSRPAPSEGDEQPLDAAALVEALVEACTPTGGRAVRPAGRAGLRVVPRPQPAGLPVYDFATGGCHDGLGPAGLSDNEGAESTLAFLQALLALDGAGLQRFVGRRGDEGRAPRADRLAHAAASTTGPWELVTGLLADGLVARGVDVTLFATLDSQTTAALDGVCPQGYAEDASRDGRVWEALHVGHAFARSARVRPGAQPPRLAAAGLRPRTAGRPLVTTIHGFSDPRILPAYRAADSAYVSISDADRVPELDYVATVYHGIDLSRFAFSATPGEDLVILGRIHPDKGTAEAIEIARRCGRRLLIAGPVAGRALLRERGRAARRRRPGPLPRLGRAGAAGGAARPRPPPCCIRSPSPSRSGCRWSRRWPRARRSSRTPRGRCPRWSTRA